MVVYDKATGRSRGYGFVRFSDEQAASAAKDAMDGRVIKRKTINLIHTVSTQYRIFFRHCWEDLLRYGLHWNELAEDLSLFLGYLTPAIPKLELFL